VAGDYYRLPNQGETTEEAFFLQLQAASRLQALVLLVNFNHSNIRWKSSTAICRRSRRFLKCLEDNFLSQVIDNPARADVLLDLLAANTSELIRDIKIIASQGCSDHAFMEFAVLKDTG